METYFRSTDDSYGGMVCEGETGMHDVFKKMEYIKRKSFEDVGGEYIPRDDNEQTCAIRLPPNKFFEVRLVPIPYIVVEYIVRIIVWLRGHM